MLLPHATTGTYTKIVACVLFDRSLLFQVWDMNNLTKSSHVIQTITPVAQIRWRPQRKYHIASCSLLLDFSVNVWDIKRPYIPFASFTEHKDCVTGALSTYYSKAFAALSGLTSKIPYRSGFRIGVCK